MFEHEVDELVEVPPEEEESTFSSELIDHTSSAFASMHVLKH